MTIPATILLVGITLLCYIVLNFLQSFIFFGFLVAGEEIESMYFFSPCFRLALTEVRADPFGYDKNDLNLDHFTNNIIRELCPVW